MNQKQPVFKKFTDALGEDRDFLFDKDATRLRWMGFTIGQTVCNVEFEDEEGNSWECDFRSIGDQELKFDEERLDEDFIPDGLLKDAIETFEKAEVHVEEWQDDGMTINEAVSEIFEHYIGEANGETLYAKHLPIVELAIKYQVATWVDNSWIEPKYTVRNPNKDIILDNYASNMILGEGIYWDVEAIRDTYKDPEYLAQIVEAYGFFFRTADAS